MKSPIVSKHGGNNMANPEAIARVRQMVMANPDRRFIVVSAPGKDGSYCKITDALIACYRKASAGQDFQPELDVITRRYIAIAKAFDVDFPKDFGRLQIKLEAMKEGKRAVTYDWVVSRGEYFMAQLMAEILDGTFVDTKGLIRIDARGNVLEESYTLIKQAIAETRGIVVLPGFYGSNQAGCIQLFSRGGSDITGAVVAAAIGASCYENVKEEPGVALADPRIVTHETRYFPNLSYRMMYEMSARGAQVLHPSAVYPVAQREIPIHFIGLDSPDSVCTVVGNGGNPDAVALAGRKNCIGIRIYKAGIDTEVGFGEHVLEVLRDNDISFQHMATGEQDIMVVMTEDQLATDGRDTIQTQLLEALDAEIVFEPLSVVSIISEGRVTDPRFVRDIFSELANLDAGIQMLTNVGSRSINIGVDPEIYEDAIRALYKLC